MAIVNHTLIIRNIDLVLPHDFLKKDGIRKG